jgi:hypothetical protein
VRTAFIVVAVALVGILATADALRGHEPEPSNTGEQTTPQRPSSLAETLREELVIGRLFWSDEECRLHSLALPQMDDDVVGEGDLCRFDSTDGWILREGERLSPNWRLMAQCRGDEIVVRDTDEGDVRRRIRGCVPAWREQVGNRLTWARGEAVYERGRPVLNAKDLHEIARHHPNISDLGVPFRVLVTDLAWLDPEHLIVSLAIRARFGPSPEFLAVLLEGKTVLGQATTFQGRLGHWFASSAGSFAASEEGTILTAGGEAIARPNEVPGGPAVAFSPDERWLAFVTGWSVYLVGTPRNNEPGRIIRIPIPARDLGWERITTSPTFPTASG